jgi:hypothetical protein
MLFDSLKSDFIAPNNTATNILGPTFPSENAEDDNHENS